MTYFTSYHALKQRANLKEGETLLVLGAAGGVGSTAVELGKLMGAKVIAAASSEEKLALCRELGADETINYSEQDLKGAVKELTGGKGVDVVYDPVGGDYAEPALRGMAWNGRYLVIGFASRPDSRDSSQPDPAQGLLHRRCVLGALYRRGARGASAEHQGALGAVCRG
jgi:NADPH2:quinone reductase